MSLGSHQPQISGPTLNLRAFSVNKANRTATESRKSDNRKQAVSIRLSRSDVRQIKRLADRLGVRDSDVVRFAIKTMLVRLAPLPDPAVTGHGLVPVFLEAGSELMSHFDLDVDRLAGIINEGADDHRRVAAEDVQLIALRAVQGSYRQLRSGEPGGARLAVNVRAESGRAGEHGGDAEGDTRRQDAGVRGAGDDAHEQSLRRYLYNKYLYTGFSEGAGQSPGAP
jgi:hypothetical protein